MKRSLLFILTFSLFIPSHSFGAQQAAPPQPQEAQKGRLKGEAALWKKGLAAAKKKHWNRKALTPSERRAYRSVLKRVGGLTVLLTTLGIAAEDQMNPDRMAMGHAVLQGDAAAIQRLVDGGMDPNAEIGLLTDRLLARMAGVRNTPLDIAVNFAHTEDDHNIPEIQALIDGGAQVPGYALVLAVQKGFPDLVQVLIDGGAPLEDAVNRQGKTVLDIAREMQEENDTEEIRRIIQILRTEQGIPPTKSAAKR